MSLRTAHPVSPDDRLIAGVTAIFANGPSMRSLFGVTETQSRASGYAPHEPGAGLRDVAVNLGWNHSLGARALATLGIVGRGLVGDVKDSPITRQPRSVGAILLLSYRL